MPDYEVNEFISNTPLPNYLILSVIMYFLIYLSFISLISGRITTFNDPVSPYCIILED